MDDAGYSALHYICDRPANELVYDDDASDYGKRVSIPERNISFVELLCRNGANPLLFDPKNPLGISLYYPTPLGLAVINRRWDAVRYLKIICREKGYLLRDGSGSNVANAYNCLKNIALKLTETIRLLPREYLLGLSMYFQWIDARAIDGTKTLMQTAVDFVEASGEAGRTNAFLLIEAMIHLGSDPSKIFINQEKTRTVFHQVFQNKKKVGGFFYVAKTFVESMSESALADFRDAAGNTVYHLAAESNEDYILSTVFKRTQLSETLGNKRGETPLDIAERLGNDKVVNYLKRHDNKVAALVSDFIIKA